MRFFENDDDINNHVTNEDYGTDSLPYLCMGVSFMNTPIAEPYDYSYKLRFNVSGGDQEIFSTLFSPKTIPFVK